jgi:hypothetical protein
MVSARHASQAPALALVLPARVAVSAAALGEAMAAAELAEASAEAAPAVGGLASSRWNEHNRSEGHRRELSR